MCVRDTRMTCFNTVIIYYIIHSLFFPGGKLRGQAELSVLLFVSSLIGIFSCIYILVLCDAFSFM